MIEKNEKTNDDKDYERPNFNNLERKKKESTPATRADAISLGRTHKLARRSIPRKKKDSKREKTTRLLMGAAVGKVGCADQLRSTKY